VEAGWADPSCVERIPLIAAATRPAVVLAGRPAAQWAPDAGAGGLEHAGGSNEKEQPRENDWRPRDGNVQVGRRGEEFVIGHNPQSTDRRVAEKQSGWLEKVLAEAHERDG